MSKISMDKKLLLGSIVSLIYFLSLMTISYLKVEIILIGVLVELLTIPFVFLLVILFYLSFKNWRKEQLVLRSNYLTPFVVTSLNIALLVVATLCDSCWQ